MNCIIITGPTGSGKSKLALSIAKNYNGCIINADSQQILKELPILTDQPEPDEVVEMFLYGHKTCKEEYSSFQWCIEVEESIKIINKLKKIPIIVGGTGFYINNLINGHFVDNQPYSPKINFLKGMQLLKILINPNKEELKSSCTERIEQMFPRVIDEVTQSPNDSRLEKVIGFFEIKNNLPDAKEKIMIKTQQYIKRQKTWFKKYCSDWNLYDSIDNPRIQTDLDNFIDKINYNSSKA